MSEIAVAKGQSLTRVLKSKKGKDHGSIIIKLEELDTSVSGDIEFHLAGQKLAKKDFFGKSG